MGPGHLIVALSLLSAAATPSRAEMRGQAPRPARPEVGAATRHQPDDAGVRSQTDSGRGALYDRTINRVAAREGVDPRLVRAVILVESAYQSDARSPKGAMGLMQLMPATARRYTLANVYDPVANIEAGVKHLKSLVDRFPLDLALAAYNAGEAAVERFNGIPPFPETQDYVARVLQLIGRDGPGRAWMRQRMSYGATRSSANRTPASRLTTAARSAPDPWRAARGVWREAQPVRVSAQRWP